MNEFSLCAFADEVGSEIDLQIKALKENGIELIELRGVDGTNISEISVKKAAELKNRLDVGGISVWSIGSPVGKVSVLDDFSHHKESFKHILELSFITGAECIRLFSFYIPEKATAVDYRDEVLERLSWFCETAKGSGVILCHENEKGIYGDSAENCLDIHRNIEGLKAVFDPANFIQCSQDTLSAWDMLEPYIYYLHIKDALENGSVVPAGMGVGNVDEIIKRYGVIGGRVLTLEPHLSVFEGLEMLENAKKSEVDIYTYKTHREAFDCAVTALKKLIT